MDTILQLDGELLIWIQQLLHSVWLTPVMKVITLFGEYGIFWIVLCLVLIMFKKTRRLGIICLAALAFTFVINNLTLKLLIDRERPWTVFEDVIQMLPHPGDSSFPSGHSANSMGPAWAMFLASLPAKVQIKSSDGKLRIEKNYDRTPCLGWNGVGADARLVHRFSIAAVVLALLVGLSRLYLGMHYPTDVACGLLVGVICATIVYKAITAFEKKHGTIGSGCVLKKDDGAAGK